LTTKKTDMALIGPSTNQAPISRREEKIDPLYARFVEPAVNMRVKKRARS
jgi:hypothetical protein